MKIGQNILIWIILIFSSSCISYEENPHVILELNKKYNQSDFELIISTDKQSYSEGETPKIELELINQSSDHVLFLPYSKGRLPITKIEIYKDDTLLDLNFLQCAMIDDLNLNEFVKLSPGDSFDPSKKSNGFREVPIGILKKKGRYKLKYFYSTQEDTLFFWLGREQGFELETLSPEKRTQTVQKYQELFNKMPYIELESDFVEFEVR